MLIYYSTNNWGEGGGGAKHAHKLEKRFVKSTLGKNKKSEKIFLEIGEIGFVFFLAEVHLFSVSVPAKSSI